MQDIIVKDIAAHLGEEVRLQGWVRNIRSSGKLLFIIFRDGSGEVQAVAFKPDLGEEAFEEAKRLSLESSVIICGVPKEHQKLVGQYELSVTRCKLCRLPRNIRSERRNMGGLPALKPTSLDSLSEAMGDPENPSHRLFCDLRISERQQFLPF
jgi:asparaginyl-tRNA synthetase